MENVWVLIRTDYVGTQCTGWPEREVLLCVFSKKPDLKTIAPYLGSSLSSDMGEAIAQVQTLLDSGSIGFENRDEDYSLFIVPLNKKIGEVT